MSQTAKALRDFYEYHTVPYQDLTPERRVELSDIRILIEAAKDALDQQESQPQSRNHYWTPDQTNRFCVICGDNDLGSVWGIHRFQIQPTDPDFKAESASPSMHGSVSVPDAERADGTSRSAAIKANSHPGTITNEETS